MFVYFIYRIIVLQYDAIIKSYDASSLYNAVQCILNAILCIVCFLSFCLCQQSVFIVVHGVKKHNITSTLGVLFIYK